MDLCFKDAQNVGYQNRTPHYDDPIGSLINKKLIDTLWLSFEAYPLQATGNALTYSRLIKKPANNATLVLRGTIESRVYKVN